MALEYIDTPEWDKTFAKSDKVNHKKVSLNWKNLKFVYFIYVWLYD